MKKTLACCVTILVLSFTAGSVNAQNSFVGAKTCKPCHSNDKLAGTAFTVWSKTAHANAFKTLQSEQANKIAKDKGLKTAAAESPECLKCHIVGGGKSAKVSKEEGVSCEACHGAASGFKANHVKPENKAKAIAAGMILPSKDDPKPCQTCHNEESPTFKKFVLAEYWTKIAHSGKPKK
jgi:hypothetical protein